SSAANVLPAASVATTHRAKITRPLIIAASPSRFVFEYPYPRTQASSSLSRGPAFLAYPVRHRTDMTMRPKVIGFAEGQLASKVPERRQRGDPTQCNGIVTERMSRPCRCRAIRARCRRESRTKRLRSHLPTTSKNVRGGRDRPPRADSPTRTDTRTDRKCGTAVRRLRTDTE